MAVLVPTPANSTNPGDELTCDLVISSTARWPTPDYFAVGEAAPCKGRRAVCSFSDMLSHQILQSTGVQQAWTFPREGFTQTELVRKETSVQGVGCNKCPDLSPGEKVNTFIRCAQFDDLLCQEKETVKRPCSIREAEMDAGRWFQNHVPVAAQLRITSELVIHKSRALLQSPPSSITPDPESAL